MGFPGHASGKEPACQCRRREAGSIPGSGRSPGGGHGNSLQCSCLENHMDRGAWWATGVGLQSRTRLKRLGTRACTASTLCKAGCALNQGSPTPGPWTSTTVRSQPHSRMCVVGTQAELLRLDLRLFPVARITAWALPASGSAAALGSNRSVNPIVLQSSQSHPPSPPSPWKNYLPWN